MRPAEQAVTDIENGMRTHDMGAAERDIVTLSEQIQHSGALSQESRQELTEINQKLHQQGYLPGLDIVGVDESHHIKLKDTRKGHEGETYTLDGGHVRDEHNQFHDDLQVKSREVKTWDYQGSHVSEDQTGRVTKVESRNGETLTAEYGRDGKVQSISITDNRGIPQTTTFERSADGRGWEMTGPAGQKQTVRFVHFDPHGGLHYSDSRGNAYIRDLHGHTKNLNAHGGGSGGAPARG